MIKSGQIFQGVRQEFCSYIIVCAQLQPQHLVDLLALGGQHQNGDGNSCLAQPFADFKSVQTGQHNVQNDEVMALVLGQRKTL